MTDIDDEAGRDFNALDAHEAQQALAEELGAATKEQDIVSEDQDDGAKAEVTVEWTQDDIAEQCRMVEALLFAAAEPLDHRTIAARLPVGADVQMIIDRLTEDYSGRGVVLQIIDKKWRFVTASDVAHVLEIEKVAPRRLSRAALETLAIIAYHQPCTRADVEDVRGVQVAKGSLDQLLEIGWVRLRGKRKDVPGRPTLYGTTDDFLQHFGLETVTDLPGLGDLKAAGLLDARLPPGFAVPSPVDGDDVEDDADGEDEEFIQDFHEDEDGETADA